MQGSISEEAIKVESKLNFEVVSIVFNLKYLSQNFIKLSMLGMFRNPHDKQISKKKGKNRCHKVKAAHCIMNNNIQQWKLRHTGNQKNFADNNSIFLGSESS